MTVSCTLSADAFAANSPCTSNIRPSVAQLFRGLHRPSAGKLFVRSIPHLTARLPFRCVLRWTLMEKPSTSKDRGFARSQWWGTVIISTSTQAIYRSRRSDATPQQQLIMTRIPTHNETRCKLPFALFHVAGAGALAYCCASVIPAFI